MEKVLYVEQPFPDNYIESWFLTGMKVNAHLEIQTFLDVVYDSFSLIQQFSSVILFVCVFCLLSNRTFSAESVLLIDALTLLVCVSTFIRLKTPHRIFSGWTTVVVFGAVWGFVPVISTITMGYDPNSIWLLAGLLFAVHLIYFDYGYLNNYVNEVSSGVSYNASIVATIVLASLLEEYKMLFPFIAFSVTLFNYFPLFRHFLHVAPRAPDAQNQSRVGYSVLTLFMVAVTLYLLAYFSLRYTLYYTVVVLLTTVLGPYLWVQIQFLKTSATLNSHAAKSAGRGTRPFRRLIDCALRHPSRLSDRTKRCTTPVATRSAFQKFAQPFALRM